MCGFIFYPGSWIHVYDILIVSENEISALFQCIFEKNFFLFNNNNIVYYIYLKEKFCSSMHDYTKTFKILILFTLFILYISIHF